ncbi:MAG: leucine-rich repeat domain-containing protein [Bacteroidaceae bacterium]
MRLSLLISAGLLAATSAFAHDFTAEVDGQTLCFDIVNKKARTAKVTYRGSIADAAPADAKGVVRIPARVKHGNATYTVTAIGPKAFANATELTGIVMPQGIESVGDFAFEGCTRLGQVVFPGNPVKMGQGVFFRCTAIRDVSLGSDWTTADLAMFRWSDSLSTLALPAKLEQVKNLKKLKVLTQVNVDPNNTHFAGIDGSLYNHDGTVLYGVPRSKTGRLQVKEGTKHITAGAVADCAGLTSIDLPASLETLPMRELAALDGLQTLVFRAEQPLTTGYRDGKGMLVLQVANPEVLLVVPAKSKKAYQEALATEPGEYTPDTQSGSLVFTLSAAQLPATKRIKGVKSFTQYE